MVNQTTFETVKKELNSYESQNAYIACVYIYVLIPCVNYRTCRLESYNPSQPLNEPVPMSIGEQQAKISNSHAAHAARACRERTPDVAPVVK